MSELSQKLINHQKQLGERKADLIKRHNQYETKGWPSESDPTVKEFDRDLQRWLEDAERFNWERDREEASKGLLKTMGGNPGGQKGYDGPIERVGNMRDRLTAAKFVGVDGRVIETKGAQLSPLEVDDQAIKAMDQHHRTGLPVHVKGMGAAQGSVGLKTLDASMPTMTGLIPAQLLPGIVERVWPFRIADHLPSIGGDLAQFTYIKDTTSASAQAAVVGEGQTKPTVDVALTAVTDAYVIPEGVGFCQDVSDLGFCWLSASV